jgi:adenylate cyclase
MEVAIFSGAPPLYPGVELRSREMAEQPDAALAREEAARGRLERLREAAVRVDTHPAMLEAVARLRKRVPGDARFGDRLSADGRTPPSVVAKGVSALEPGRPSALHEFGLGALQVWQSLAESAGRGRGEVEVTIVFTDLVGFSNWALEAGDEAALDLLRTVGDCVEGAFFEHGGKIVKRLGDGVMAVFDDPQDALEAALEAQERLAGIAVEGYRPKMRAGVHHGCPRKVGGDYLGVDVNVAARVAEQAKGCEVLVSEPTWEQLETEGLTTSRARRLRADGAPREMRVRAVSR